MDCSASIASAAQSSDTRGEGRLEARACSRVARGEGLTVGEVFETSATFARSEGNEARVSRVTEPVAEKKEEPSAPAESV